MTDIWNSFCAQLHCMSDIINILTYWVTLIYQCVYFINLNKFIFLILFFLCCYLVLVLNLWLYKLFWLYRSKLKHFIWKSIFVIYCRGYRFLYFDLNSKVIVTSIMSTVFVWNQYYYYFDLLKIRVGQAHATKI